MTCGESHTHYGYGKHLRAGSFCAAFQSLVPRMLSCAFRCSQHCPAKEDLALVTCARCGERGHVVRYPPLRRFGVLAFGRAYCGFVPFAVAVDLWRPAVVPNCNDLLSMWLKPRRQGTTRPFALGGLCPPWAAIEQLALFAFLIQTCYLNRDRTRDDSSVQGDHQGRRWEASVSDGRCAFMQ